MVGARKKDCCGNSSAYHLIGARYYDVDLGMWISVDPMRQHFSPYTYGANNPIMRVDPNGNMDVEGMFRWMFNFSGSNEVGKNSKITIESEMYKESTTSSELSLGKYKLELGLGVFSLQFTVAEKIIAS